MKFWQTVTVVVSVSLPFFLGSVQAQDAHFPLVYFSEVDAEGTPQLRVLEQPGQARDVFASDNDGYFSDLSPDSSHIALARYEWDEPPLEAQAQLWIAALQTGQQWPVGSPGKAVGGEWSPNGENLLFRKLQVVAPLWAGYNYGQLSIYSVVHRIVVPLRDVRGFALDWYPDSKHLLMWYEEIGYFVYSLADGETQPLVTLSETIEVPRWADVSPTKSIIAIPLRYGLGLYDANSGQELQRILQSTGDSTPDHPSWSPDGRYLAVELANNDVAVWDYEASELVTRVENPVDDPPTGYFFELFWSASPQRLFIIIYRHEGMAIYQVNTDKGRLTEVYNGDSGS